MASVKLVRKREVKLDCLHLLLSNVEDIELGSARLRLKEVIRLHSVLTLEELKNQLLDSLFRNLVTLVSRALLPQLLCPDFKFS